MKHFVSSEATTNHRQANVNNDNEKEQQQQQR